MERYIFLKYMGLLLVHSYANGLMHTMRSRKQIKYSFEKKIAIVELYLSSEISYQDLAIREGRSDPSLIGN